MIANDRDKYGEDDGALDQRPPQLLEVAEEAHGLAPGVDRGGSICFFHWSLLVQVLT